MIREIKGFSLMELMIVVVLIGILSAGGILFFGDRAEQCDWLQRGRRDC